MRKLLGFLNPIEQLGNKNYSITFPLLFSLSVSILSEIYAYSIAKNPMIVGTYIIFVNVTCVIYFAFRNGIKGGFTAVIIPIAYYFYIIYTRNYPEPQRSQGIITTIILGLIYFLLAGIIGWLRQTIDTLIEREADEKNRLQAIIQQLPVGVLITDSEGKIEQGNKQINLILGREMRKGLKAGKDNLENTTLDGHSVNPSEWPLAQTIATGKSVNGKEFVFERKDGKKKYLQISASLIRNRTGKVIAAASIINDITEQKEMEERKDDFVNMASHELKTPITSMKLYVDSLISRMKKIEDERTVRTLTGIKNQTERLQRLVNDLLDVSRLQTGKLSFAKEPVEIGVLLEETIGVLQESSKQHQIKIVKKIPLTVYADKFRIYQVITNIITNAVKYSPAGKNINVRLERKKDKMILSVQDYGLGIAKDQQKKIFDRLYQVTDDTEKTFPGFGMGLYISKEIVTRHKGNIWVESEKGKGSTFYFSLPIYKAINK